MARRRTRKQIELEQEGHFQLAVFLALRSALMLKGARYHAEKCGMSDERFERYVRGAHTVVEDDYTLH